MLRLLSIGCVSAGAIQLLLHRQRQRRRGRHSRRCVVAGAQLGPPCALAACQRMRCWGLQQLGAGCDLDLPK